MRIYFTSAQVKYYVSEPDSAWIRQVVDSTDPDTGKRINHLFTAIITEGLAVDNPYYWHVAENESNFSLR